MSSVRATVFREVRGFRGGALPVTVAILGVAAIVGWRFFDEPRVLLLLVLAAAYGALVFFGQVELIVDDSVVAILRRPGPSTRVPLADIVDVRLEFDDSAWSIYGGWNPRHSAFSQELSALGANTPVGNRAVVVTRTDGREVWLGTWRPNELQSVLRQAAAADVPDS